MIIVGLGNPGKEYQETRHNVGFMIVNKFVDDVGASAWKQERDVAWTKIGEHLIIKPQTFMNRSGEALLDFLKYKNIPHQHEDLMSNLLVIHDELDFDEETLKLQHAKSSAGHNGVQSIIDAFGGWNGFERLRFGIGDNRMVKLSAEEYVLSKFTPDQQTIIERKIGDAVQLLRSKLTR